MMERFGVVAEFSVHHLAVLNSPRTHPWQQRLCELPRGEKDIGAQLPLRQPEQVSATHALVVSPNTLAFCARVYSVRLKMSFFGCRKGTVFFFSFFSSRLCMMVRGALLRAYHAFNPRGWPGARNVPASSQSTLEPRAPSSIHFDICKLPPRARCENRPNYFPALERKPVPENKNATFPDVRARRGFLLVRGGG